MLKLMLMGLIELVYMKVTFIFRIALIHLWTKEKERLVLGENKVTSSIINGN